MDRGTLVNSLIIQTRLIHSKNQRNNKEKRESGVYCIRVPLFLSMNGGGKMYYGYVGYSRSTDKVYVITKGHETPEAADEERTAKVKSLPRHIYLANYFLSHGVLKCPEPIEIPEGYWGVAV